MKENKASIVFKGLLALLLVCTSVGTFLGSHTIAAETVEMVKEVVTYEEDKTKASIIFEALRDNYELLEVKNPDGTLQDLINPKGYAVDKNGEYTFFIRYIVRGSEADEVLSIIKKIKVSEIQTKKVETEARNKPLSRSVTTNGGSTVIEILDYDAIAGWKNGKSKDVAVHIDFGEDNTTSNKQLIIDLPAGMKYDQILTSGSFSLTGVDTKLLAPFVASNPLAKAVVSMELPKKSNYGSFFTSGRLVYNFDAGTKAAKIDIKVSVDPNIYYRAKELVQPISAQGYMGTPKQDFGLATQTVYAVGTPVGSGYGISTDETTNELVPSIATQKSTGKAYLSGARFYDNNAMVETGVVRRYVKRAKYYIYYPEGTNYDSFVYKYSGAFPAGSVTNDRANSRVIVDTTWSSWYHYNLVYSVPADAAFGVHKNKAYDYVEVEYYDGETETITPEPVLPVYSVNVIDPNNVVNSMAVTYMATAYSDMDIDKVYTRGPFFRVGNKTAGIKENQVVHFKIDANWQAISVNLPFDKSIATNKVTNFQYKTNKNSSWRTFHGPFTYNPLNVEVKRYTVGLDNDEYFSEVRAEVGSFSGTYWSHYDKAMAVVSTFGRLASGTKANVTLSMYDKDDEAGTKVSATGTINMTPVNNKALASASSSTFKDENGASITQIGAGENFSVNATIRPHQYPYGTTEMMKAPEIYIRQPEGLHIAIDTLKFENNFGEDLTGKWNYTTHLNDDGETMYKILFTDDVLIGAYYGEEMKMFAINLSYSVETSPLAKGNLNIREMIAWGRSNYRAVVQNDVAPFIDIYDFNGNGNLSEGLLSLVNSPLKVVENKAMLVESFLSLAGEDPMEPYVDGNDNTVAYFTPGTKADYAIKATNNADSSASAFDLFVPIPKTGSNLGTVFQATDFKWDMTLINAIALDPSLAGKFAIYYSTDATASTYDSTATYTQQPPAKLEDVVMIKIAAMTEVAAGDSIEIQIPLKVDEDFESASSGGKIGKRNIYNPVFNVDGESFRGTVAGTKVGTELSIAEIGGTIFVDKNGDGLYKAADGDQLIADHEVELYLWNDGSNQYEAALDGDGDPIKGKSNNKGVYRFDNTTGMTYGNYAVRFVEKTGAVYEYTIHNTSDRSIDSDAIISNDIPNLGDTYRGWVVDIDPTNPYAKSIGCGFLKYNPPIDLKVSIKSTPNSVKVGEKIRVGANIEPDFWENMKDPITPYVWTIVGDASEKAKATLTLDSDGSVIITPAALASGSTTFRLQLTILDAYGNAKTSAPSTITITSSVLPTITAADQVVYVGDDVDLLDGVHAVDNAGNSITLVTNGVNANTQISHQIPMQGVTYKTAGTYKVTYAIQDLFGNTQSKDCLIRVHEAPHIKAMAQMYTLGDPNIITSVESSVTASWKQAPALSGYAIEVDIPGPATPIQSVDKIGYSVSGPSIDFSVVGIYQVTYTATNIDGKITSKTVGVLVSDANIISDPSHTLLMSGKGFSLRNVDAKALNAVLAKEAQYGNVRAYKVEYDTSGNPTDFIDISDRIVVNANELANIQNVSATGGIYPLSFGVTDGDKRLTMHTKVAIEGEYVPPVVVTPENTKLAMEAKSFDLSYVDAIVLDEAKALQQADVKAVILEDIEGSSLFGIRLNARITLHADAAQLAQINRVTKQGGVYPLQVIARYTQAGVVSEVTTTVNVRVAGEGIHNPSTTVSTGDTTNIVTYLFTFMASGLYFVTRRRKN